MSMEFYQALGNGIAVKLEMSVEIEIESHDDDMQYEVTMRGDRTGVKLFEYILVSPDAKTARAQAETMLAYLIEHILCRLEVDYDHESD